MGATIPLCEPCLDGNAERYLQECLKSTFVSSVGPFVERFEREFAAYVGSPHAVACASGTAAIHLALRALGVGRGDLVLCADFTFIATANPVVYQGAIPCFIDSEPASWNMDPRLLANALDELAAEKRLPKAVIAVHILGQPADLGPILDACARHRVPLIEDAAEALGASYGAGYPHPACRGRQVGSIGHVGCYSFNGNKIITTGGGGMITTADGDLAKRIKHLSTQAKQPGLAFVHDHVGYNYRMPNLNAALGVAQLERMPAFLARKRAIAERYRSACSELGFAFQPALVDVQPSWWLPSLTVGSIRDKLLERLTVAGIGARPLWLPVSEQPCYASLPSSASSTSAPDAVGPGRRIWSSGLAKRLAREGLSLPCSVGLDEATQERVIAELANAARAVATASATR